MRSRVIRIRTGVWLGIGIIIGFGGLILFFTGARAGWFRAGSTAPIGVELQVIPRPSSTATSSPTTEPTLVPTPTAFDPTPTLMEGEFGVGSLVEVAGTGGDPLRFRVAADLQAEIRFFGLEHEVFEVLEGPVESDGYSWWFLSNPYDDAKQGWAVGLYLRPIDSP